MKKILILMTLLGFSASVFAMTPSKLYSLAIKVQNKTDQTLTLHDSQLCNITSNGIIPAGKNASIICYGTNKATLTRFLSVTEQKNTSKSISMQAQDCSLLYGGVANIQTYHSHGLKNSAFTNKQFNTSNGYKLKSATVVISNKR